jgi:hypothetical protein
MRRLTRQGSTFVGVSVLSLSMLVPVLAQRGGGPGGGGGGSKPAVSHKARQDRPIQLGVSGGNATDIANGYCCSGTLGALVEKDGQQFILSNSHVFAHDVSGPDVAEIGDPINQSGLIDVACQDRPADYVANLSSLSSLNPGFFSPVDAALASVVPNMVRTDGAILEIGPISSTPASAFLTQRVKKSGRTTGLTASRIEGLNATISVGYSTECGGTQFSTTFSGQIIVGNRGSKFIAGGDSGSLMVEDVGSTPRAVGLLFAGSSSIAVANPIGDVLAYFDANLVGAGAGGTSATGEDGATAQGTARALAAQQRNAGRLISVPGAVGHAVGLAGNGIVIKVYVTEATERARQATPNQVDGVPVVLEETGPIVAIGSMLPCAQAR